MRTPLDLRALALEMKAAQDAARQLVPFTTRLPDFDLSAAYEVALLVHRARLTEGAKPVGRKIGFTNPDMWAKFSVREPIWAYMYDTTVVRLGGVHVTCSLGRLVEPKIEPEIVFGFRTAPRAGGLSRRGVSRLRGRRDGPRQACALPGVRADCPGALWVAAHATESLGDRSK